MSGSELSMDAGYWRNVGESAFMQETQVSLAAYRKAVDLDPENPDGWRYVGELLFRLGDYLSARNAFVHLQQIGEKTDDLQIRSIASLRLNWVEQAIGNRDEANRLSAQALQFAQSAGWREGIADAYSNMGVICKNNGDLAGAEELHLKSLEIDQELGRQRSIADDYGNLGIVYKDRDELERAEEAQKKCIEINRGLGRKESEAKGYGNLGVIYRKQGNLSCAEEAQLKSLKLSEDIGYKDGIANANANLGLIYQDAGDTEKMLASWRKAYDLCREIGSDAKAAAIGEMIKASEAA